MPKLIPTEVRVEARGLRQEGVPLKRIAVRLGVSVATVHAWTRDIELTEEQRRRNLHGPTGPQSEAHIARRTAAWSALCRARRLAYQAEGRARARLGGDRLHHAGCMLYWAEGAKSRNTIKFTNSDVPMTRLFRRFLRESLGIVDERIRLTLNVYTNNGLTVTEIERHWLDTLEFPRARVGKHMLNHTPTSSSGRAKNRLIYGVCTLTVGDTRAVQHIYGAIQEYGGFDEPRWLD